MSRTLSAASFKDTDVMMRLCLCILGGNIFYYYLQNAVWESFKLSADLFVYYSAAKSIWTGHQELLYDSEYYRNVLGAVGPYQYPPFFAVLMAPFSVIPFKIVSIGWLGLNHLFMFGCVFMIWYETHSRNIWILLCLLLLCCFYGPLIANTHWANVNALVWFCMVAGWWTFKHDRPYWCGFMLALGTIVKLFPALLIGYFIYRRAWRVVIGAGAALAGMTLFTMIALGGYEAHVLWYTVRVAELSVGGGIGGSPIDQSLTSFFRKLASQGFIDPILARPLFWVSAILISAASYIMCRSKPLTSPDKIYDMEYGLVALLPVLASPAFVSFYHYTTLMATYMILTCYLINHPDRISPFIYTGLGISYALTSFGAFGGPAFSSGIMILFQSPKLYGALILWTIIMHLLYRMRAEEKTGTSAVHP